MKCPECKKGDLYYGNDGTGHTYCNKCYYEGFELEEGDVE